MRQTKKVLCLVLCLALVLSVAVPVSGAGVLSSQYASYAAAGHSNAPQSETRTLSADNATIAILTTTDMHGRVYDWNPYTDSALSNNYLQAAEIIARQRALADDSLVIDVGDVLQGSAISSYNILQQNGKNSPMAIALRSIGYDVFTLGNHEFNFTPEIQWNFYNMLADTDESLPGSPVSVICANVIENDTQESVFAPYKLFTYVFPDGTEYTIGVLCFDNMNNANWDVASHYEGCSFSHKDNETNSYVYEYETYWAQELAEKTDYLIVALHSGDGSADTYNQENQAAYFIANTTGVDLVLNGHNHQKKATTYKNQDGQDVPLLNGGGSAVGELVLSLSKTEDGVTVSATEPTLYALNTASQPGKGDQADYVSGNEAYDGLKDLMKESFLAATDFVNTEIGTVSGAWDDKSNHYYEQTDSYDLVHKAQIWAATTSTGIDPEENHVISMTSPVASNNFKISDLLDGREEAPISLKDCYSLYRYDNNTLFMVKLSGKQLNAWMQATANTYTYAEEGGRVPAGTLTGAGFGTDNFYGLNYTIYMQNAKGARVQNVTYADGTPVLDSDEIYLCMSSYRLSATADSDAYGWYAATGITSSSEEVVWDATVSEEFNTVGGSCPLIVGEYIQYLTAQGLDVTPGSETHWSIVNEMGAPVYCDVDENAWYMPYVDTAGILGLMVGVGDNRFSPESAMTRAQLVTTLWRLVEQPKASAAAPFEDVAEGRFYTDAIAWAAEKKLVLGVSETSFSPDRPVSRQEAATILHRFAQYLEMGNTETTGDLTIFPDSDSVFPFAQTSVSWAVGTGLLEGVKDGDAVLLKPTASVSRAQAAALLVRFLLLDSVG